VLIDWLLQYYSEYITIRGNEIVNTFEDTPVKLVRNKWVKLN
jgi:hypothetical protein